MADIEYLTTPGHDRDVALAILNQAQLRSSPIDDIQVRHLLAIGYRAGLAAATKAAMEALEEDDGSEGGGK